MRLKEEFVAAQAGWRLLTLYQKFEHAIILVLNQDRRDDAGEMCGTTT